MVYKIPCAKANLCMWADFCFKLFIYKWSPVVVYCFVNCTKKRFNCLDWPEPEQIWALFLCSVPSYLNPHHKTNWFLLSWSGALFSE